MRIKGSGRKKSLNDKDREALLENVEKNPMISAEKTGKTVTGRTIQNELNGKGVASRVPRKLPCLSEKNIDDRLNKVRIWSSWSLGQWYKVLFSDETKINLFSSDGRVRVWRRPNEELFEKNILPTTKHGGGGVMAWGCMSSKGVGRLVFIDGIMDKYSYKRILVENLEISCKEPGLGDDFLFQQDNDPKHTSQYVQEFFKHNEITVLDWPSQSPDLNPIEHLWDFVKREVRKRGLTSIRDLKEKVKAIWDEITLEQCRKLVNTMPKRIEELFRNRGKHTRY
jgi:DDE superfamily endonuclease/Transposase